MKGEYINESLNWAGSEEVSAAYYHAAVARARRLHAEATTPRLKHCLRQLITKLEGLARDVQTESGFSCKKPSAPMTDMAVSSRRNRTRTSGAVKAVTLANDEFLGLLELALNEVSHRFRDEWSNCDQRRSS